MKGNRGSNVCAGCDLDEGVGNLLGGWASSIKSFYQMGQQFNKHSEACLSQNEPILHHIEVSKECSYLLVVHKTSLRGLDCGAGRRLPSLCLDYHDAPNF